MADADDAWVFAAGLLDFLVVVHTHGVKLPDLDILAVLVMAFLHEQHWAEQDNGDQRDRAIQ